MEDHAREIVTERVCPNLNRSQNSQIVRRDGKLVKITGNAEDHIFEKYETPASASKFQDLVDQMQLPDGSVEACDTAELHRQLAECFSGCASLAPEDAKRIAFYVLLTWVADQLEFCPPLLLLASSPGDGLPLLHVLKSCCRNALGLRNCATVAELPEDLEPSLLMDLTCFSRSRVRMIASASSRNLREHVRDKLLNVAMPKIILCRESLGDVPALEVALRPCAVNIPRAHVLKQLADRFQPQLLAYRLGFREHEPVDQRSIIAGNSTALIANALFFTAEGDTELRAQLMQILDVEAQASLAELLVTPESLVVESVVAALHSNKIASLTCGEIAEHANILAEARSESSNLTARRVGSLLRLLGIPTRRIPGRGRGILFDSKTRETAHEAARARNLPVLEKPADSCPNCKWKH